VLEERVDDRFDFKSERFANVEISWNATVALSDSWWKTCSGKPELIVSSTIRWCCVMAHSYFRLFDAVSILITRLFSAQTLIYMKIHITWFAGKHTS
jgi:hypothetical protein